MVHKDIKSGYNSVSIYGDSEKMTIVRWRSNSYKNTTVINRNPGFFERLLPTCYEDNLFLINPTEEAFRKRIKRAVKIALDEAIRYDHEDAEQAENLRQKKKIEEQKAMDLDQFAESLKGDNS